MKNNTMLKYVLPLSLCLLAGCSSGTPSTTPASSVATSEAVAEVSEEETGNAVDDAILAYADFLKNGGSEKIMENILTGEKEIHYTLIHLDDDTIPELAISLGNSHSAGVSFYSYDGENVYEILTTGSFGVAYYKKELGNVVGTNSGMGMYYTSVIHVDDGQVKEGTSLQLVNIEEATEAHSWDKGGEGYYFAKWNGGLFPDTPAFPTKEGEEITKEEYDRLLDNYGPYLMLAYDQLPVLDDTADVVQTLKNSLENEDMLPNANKIPDPRQDN